MASCLVFITFICCLLHVAGAQVSTATPNPPPAAYSNLLDLSFSTHTSTNLSLPLHLIQPPNVSDNQVQITCHESPTPTRQRLLLSGCAEVAFTLLGANEITQPKKITPSTPWTLPATYADTKDTCEVRLEARQSVAEDVFPLSLVLQTAAQIAFRCSKPGQPSQNLGGTAVIGAKGVFLLDVYGPALPVEAA